MTEAPVYLYDMLWPPFRFKFPVVSFRDRLGSVGLLHPRKTRKN